MTTTTRQPESPVLSGDVSTFPLAIGCRRSGVGLLRAMCDSHPLMAVVPPAPFVRLARSHGSAWSPTLPFDADRFVEQVYASEDIRHWRLPRAEVALSFGEDPPATYAEATRRFYRLWAERSSKPRYMDATPGTIEQVDGLVKLFPEAMIIHVVRDGRNVAASLLERRFVSRLEDGMIHWQRQVRTARQSLLRFPTGRHYELRYEDLVRSPEATLRKMCDAIELPFDPAMVDYRRTAAEMVRRSPQAHHHRNLVHPLLPDLRDWRRDLPTGAVDRLDALGGNLLIELGYEVRRRRRPTTRIAARVRGRGWRRRVQSSSAEAASVPKALPGRQILKRRY
jgi:hypothetical protein